MNKYANSMRILGINQAFPEMLYNNFFIEKFSQWTKTLPPHKLETAHKSAKERRAGRAVNNQ